MLNFVKLTCFLSMFFVVNGIAEDRFTSACKFNSTEFVREGSFVTIGVDETLDISIYRGIIMRKPLFAASMLKSDMPHIQSFDDRVNISPTGKRRKLTIQDVIIDDSGMYMMKYGRTFICWELFVVGIWNPKGMTTFEEFLPAHIDASPPASRVVKPHVGATATWLLDGMKISHSSDFMEQDGRMIVMRMPRYLNDKNVTYRITRHNGDVHDVNLTLWVSYGPYSPLQFNPSGTSYFVKSGDILPDITCSTDCNPPCEITWDRSGVGNVLSLGQVDESSKGMYTCQATRNGTDRIVERSLYVEVNGVYIDETSFIVAVSVLGTMLGLTLVFLSVCSARWCRTSGRNGSWAKGETGRVADEMQNRKADIAPIEMEYYEELDRSRNMRASYTQDTYEIPETETVAGPM